MYCEKKTKKTIFQRLAIYWVVLKKHCKLNEYIIYEITIKMVSLLLIVKSMKKKIV